jgi:hypothetical protein
VSDETPSEHGKVQNQTDIKELKQTSNVNKCPENHPENKTLNPTSGTENCFLEKNKKPEVPPDTMSTTIYKSPSRLQHSM